MSEHNELQQHIQRHEQQLADLHHRLQRQERLMRMTAIFMLILFIVWLVVTVWPVI